MMFLLPFASRLKSSAVVRIGYRLLYATVLVLALAPPGDVGFAADCAQPSDSGCPITLNQPVTAVLTNASDVHSWSLTFSNAGSLHVALTNLAASYGLHVYAADGSLLGEASNDVNQDDVVDVPQAAAGTYTINVDSPGGDTSNQPYTLLVTAPNGTTASQPAAASKPTAAPAGTPNSVAAPAPGTVLLSDDFTDQHNGWLPSGPASNGFVKYLDGEYQIAATSAGNPWPGAQIPGTYSDSSIALDVRFVNQAPNVAIAIGCRSQQSHTYFARIQPQLRTVSLVRVDGTNLTNLVPGTAQGAVQRDSTNHVELKCAGTTISLLINGTLAASAQDAAFPTGTHYISAGVTSGGTSDARISHLVVTQQ